MGCGVAAVSNVPRGGAEGGWHQAIQLAGELDELFS
jgi:hypothetical protein